MKKRKIIYSKRKVDNVIIPFGKHKDKPLNEIPLSYLSWLISNDWFEGQFYELYRAVARYLNDPAIQRELESEEAEKEADEWLNREDDIPF